MEIKHFSHCHPLIPDHCIKNSFEGSCKACESEISPNAPSYGCVAVGCKFYLHEYCARLQPKIQLTGHPDHPLLLTHNPYNSEGFCCNGCSSNCQGFSYHCFECDFDLDVDCALQDLNSSPTITFQHRGHQLVLSDQPAVQNEKCFVCNKTLDLFVFRCKYRLCLYRIHFHCAPLVFPKTIQSKHKHRLTFREKFTEDDTGEYYCDACEERRHPDHPVYYCVQCNSASAPYTAHMACALPHEVLRSLVTECESSKRFIETPTNHQHHLNLTSFNAEPSHGKCTVCKSRLGDHLKLKCEECKVYLHYGCRELETEVEHPIHPQHSLSLHVDTADVGPFFQCCACKETCFCFIYQCNFCNFKMCARCIRSLHTEITFEYQGYKLFLSKFDDRENKCYFCGTNKPSSRFICMEPGFTYNLHLLCCPFVFPPAIEREDHEHTLHLMDVSENSRCYICYATMDAEHRRLYHCETCNKYADASCALLEILPELIARFENSRSEEEAKRLREEHRNLELQEMELTDQLMAIQDRLKENSKATEAILRLEESQNASSE